MYPLNPDFYRMESIELSAPRDLTRAGELLDELGLRQKDDDGWRLRYGAPSPCACSSTARTPRAPRRPR